MSDRIIWKDDENLIKYYNNLYLDKISKYERNWNGYDADPFSEEIINKAREIVNILNIQPYIAPTANDSIQFEYKNKNNDYLEFELFSNGKIKMFTMNADGQSSTDPNINMSLMNDIINKFYDIPVIE